MIYVAILVALFSIIQVSIIRSIAIFQVTPDIVLCLVVYIALFFGGSALWFGFFAGLFLDICNLSLGYNALLMALIGYGIGIFASRLYKETPLLWIFLLFGASIFRNIIIMVAQREFSLYLLIRYVIPGTLYTTLVGIIIFHILRKVKIGKQ